MNNDIGITSRLMIGPIVERVWRLVASKSTGQVVATELAVILCIAGVLLMVLGLASVLLPVPGLGAILFWPGTGVLVIGVVISRRASRKTCPKCRQRVHVKASKCVYCGDKFARGLA